MISSGRPRDWIVGFLLCVTCPLAAQADYQGLRLAVFNVETIRHNGSSLHLRCQVANTGRLPVVLPGKVPSFPALVVELDTMHLPAILRERTMLVQLAIQRERMRLAPGEIHSVSFLSINLRDTFPEISGPTCADLVLDTAYLIDQDERTLTVAFQLRNAGTTTARLFGGDNDVVLNTYFVSGAKITRGAIFAEQIPLKMPRELPRGMLPAGKSVRWQIKVSAKNRTRFSPHLALEFDPLQVVPDCGAGKRVWVIEE